MAQARDFVGIFVGINIFAGFVLLRYQYVIVLISVLSCTKTRLSWAPVGGA
jgi:hypothetical protein